MTSGTFLSRQDLLIRIHHTDGHFSVRPDIGDAKPQRARGAALAAAQARFAQSNAADRDSHVLHDLVLGVTARRRHRLGMSFDDRSTCDQHGSFGRAPCLELEQALSSALELLDRSRGFTELGSRSRLLGHPYDGQTSRLVPALRPAP